MLNVRRLREAKGMTQVELASAAKCARSFLSEIETGKANPTQAVLAKIAEALGVEMEALVAKDPAGRPA